MTKEKEYYIIRKKLNKEWVGSLVFGLFFLITTIMLGLTLGIREYTFFESIVMLALIFVSGIVSYISLDRISLVGEVEKYKEVKEKIKVKEVKNGGRKS